MAEQELSFDLEPVSIPVTIKGKSYELREATGRAAMTHRSHVLNNTVFGSDGKPQQVKGAMANVESLLVAMCLFDDKGKAVNEQTVASWPSRIQKKLYTECRRISELVEDTNERSGLEKALALEGAPVTFAALREYVDGLADKEYKPIQDWLKPSEEELAKNEPSATTDGSESAAT